MISSSCSLLRHRRPTSLLRLLSTTTYFFSTHPHLPSNSPPILPRRRRRTLTPIEREFNHWVSLLKPGFSPADVDSALRRQTDADIAFDLFRWTAQQRNYKHNHLTYLTIIDLSFAAGRFDHFQSLVHEVLYGACFPSYELLNSVIDKLCRRRDINRAIDVFNLMRRSPSCAPKLETFTALLMTILRQFDKREVCYRYMPAVESLVKQMNISGVIPDTYTLNLVIKAYSKTLRMRDAVGFFELMDVYNCEANSYTYGYLVKGFCEKGWVDEGVKYYKEMKEKDFVATSSVYMVLICSLALVGRLDDAMEVMFQMLRNGMSPDLITYRTLLEGLVRGRREKEAFELLEELRWKEKMDNRMYEEILNWLHSLERD